MKTGLFRGRSHLLRGERSHPTKNRSPLEKKAIALWGMKECDCPSIKKSDRSLENGRRGGDRPLIKKSDRPPHSLQPNRTSQKRSPPNPRAEKSDRTSHCLESGKGDRTSPKRALPTFSTTQKSDRPPHSLEQRRAIAPQS